MAPYGTKFTKYNLQVKTFGKVVVAGWGRGVTPGAGGVLCHQIIDISALQHISDAKILFLKSFCCYNKGSLCYHFR